MKRTSTRCGDPRYFDSNVYIFRVGDQFKIGRSVNIKRRATEIKMLYSRGKPFEIVHTIKSKNAHILEEDLIRRFKSQRGRRDDFFYLSDKDIEYIKSL